MIIATAYRDGVRDEIVNMLNAALGSGAVLECRDGSTPATCEDSDTGNLIVSCNMDATPFALPVSNIAVANPITNGIAVEDGTVTYVRAKTSGGTCVLEWEIDSDFTISGQPFVVDDELSIVEIWIDVTINGE